MWSRSGKWAVHQQECSGACCALSLQGVLCHALHGWCSHLLQRGLQHLSLPTAVNMVPC